ncbi:MAG: hypothetical protein M1820_000211 [Bogoriella megaspora]|nr:MAG: hypothetical protein M1820_000211 [Bogoriella megaspora]
MQRPILSLPSLRLSPSTYRTFATSSPFRNSSFAKMTLIGRLAAEPEIVPTSTGRELIRYAIGTTSGAKENQKTNWFKVTSFDENPGRREYLLGLSKGSLVYVEADARLNSFQVDGEERPRSTLELVQRSLQVLNRNRAAEGGEGDAPPE